MYEQVLHFGWIYDAFDELLAGAWLTVWLTFRAILCGMIIAIGGAWARTAGPTWLARTFAAYVEIIRNTPFLLQLYFFFFGLPSIGVRLTPENAALLTMAINLGAYATEIIRAGIEAIPHGQFEAGAALGLHPAQVFFLIVLRPALLLIYPPLAGQFTMILLGSSVTSAISASELTSTANLLSSINFRTFETYLVVTFMYLILAFTFRGAFALFYNLVLKGPRDEKMRRS